MFKIDNLVRRLMPWVLVGFAIGYLSTNILLTSGFLLMAILFWVRKPLKNSGEGPATKNLALRGVFLAVLIAMALMINAQNASSGIPLLIMGLTIYSAIGLITWSFIKVLLN
jgi:hypothetical protein